MQKALDTFKARGFEIVAVNIHPEENDLVLPFMKGTGYGFLPVDGATIEKQGVTIRGTPTNYLIDAEGRIVFQPDVRGTESLRTFENQVEALLRRVPKS